MFPPCFSWCRISSNDISTTYTDLGRISPTHLDWCMYGSQRKQAQNEVGSYPTSCCHSTSYHCSMQCCFWCIWTRLNGYCIATEKSFCLYSSMIPSIHSMVPRVSHSSWSCTILTVISHDIAWLIYQKTMTWCQQEKNMTQSWIYQTQWILDSDVGSHMLMLRRLGATADVGWLLFKCIALQWFAGMKPSDLKWMNASATTRYAHWTVSSKS